MARRAKYKVKGQNGKTIFTANTGRKMFVNDNDGFDYKSVFGKILYSGPLSRYLIKRK